MRVLDSSYIATQLPKIIELNKGMILNGHFYSKNKLSPQQLQFAFIQGSATVISLSSKLITSVSNIVTDKQSTVFIGDLNDPSLTYFVNSDSTNEKLYKIHEEESSLGEYKQLFSVTSGIIEGFLYQDNDFIYFWTQTATRNVNIYKLSKETESCISVYSFVGNSSFAYIKFLSSINDTLFFLLFNNNKLTLISISVSSNTVKVLQEFSTTSDTSVKYSVRLSDIQELITGTKFSLYCFKPKNALQPFDYLTIDLSKTSNYITSESIAFDWTQMSEGLDLPSASPNDVFKIYEHSDSNSTYVDILYYNQGKESESILTIQGVYSFKKQTPIDLDFVSFSNFDHVNLILSSLYMNDKRNLILGFQDFARIYTWSASAKKYLNTGKTFSNCLSIGLDAAERIWILYKDTSLELYSKVTSSIMRADFDKEMYTNDGQEIETFVSFYVEDTAGNFIGIPITLTLVGDCYFKENNLKVLSTYSLASGPDTRDVVITGLGPVEVYINELMV